MSAKTKYRVLAGLFILTSTVFLFMPVGTVKYIEKDCGPSKLICGGGIPTNPTYTEETVRSYQVLIPGPKTPEQQAKAFRNGAILLIPAVYALIIFLQTGYKKP